MWCSEGRPRLRAARYGGQARHLAARYGGQARWLAVGLLAALAVAGCGFQLRGEQKLPFETIFVNTPPNSALGATLNRQIRTGTDTRTVEEPGEASAVLEILGEARDREILTLNAQGRAVE